MKKTMHDIHISEGAKTALLAAGFLGLVMFLSYLYWFA